MKTKASGARAGVRVRLESMALTLSANCPLDHTNPIFCPLHDLRLIPEMERHKWVRGLTMPDLRYLVLYHETCAIERKRLATRPRRTGKTPIVER